MNDAAILICYDGSESAQHAIGAAAEFLGPRRAVVLAVGPPLTAAESLAAIAPVTPGAAFEELNEDDARQRAQVGAEQADKRASRPKRGPTSLRRHGMASSPSRTRSMRLSSCSAPVASRAPASCSRAASRTKSQSTLGVRS